MLKGLLIKDLCVLTKQMKIVLIVLIVLSMIPSFSVWAFAIVYTVMLPMTVFAYDEQCKWEDYARMMPYKLKDFVLSKYLLGILASLLVGVIGMISSGITAALKGEPMMDPGEAAGIFVTFSASIILMSFNLPICFKFGTEKGRFLGVLLPVAVVMALGYFLLGNDSAVTFFADVPVCIAASIAVVVISLAVSMGISIQIYKRKNR